MVVQHILAVRRGKREIKVPLDMPEVKKEPTDEDNATEEKTEVKQEEFENKAEEKKDEDKDKEEMEVDVKKETEAVEPKIENTENEEKTESSENVKVDSTSEKPTDENKVESFKTEIVDVDEYFVKYRNFSYLHCEWKTEEELRRGDRRIFSKIKRFQQKIANNVNIFEYVSVHGCLEILLIGYQAIAECY